MNIRELAGRQIDEYALVDILGEGGMSAVYRAYQEELERYVAVKILSDELAQQPDYIQRFNREAKMSASLEHPHIVPVYDYGVQDDLTYVVMRLLHHTLGEVIKSGQPMHVHDIIVMVEAIARALDYAHSRGIIHRDVKPSNIMFDEQGTPYLVDFGIAKAVQADVNLTSEQLVLGTPSYMAPEQWRDEHIGSRTDQYGLAIVMFQTLTSALPFTADTPSQLMYKHLHEAPPAATDINPNLPLAVVEVLRRGMAKDINQRYPLVSNFSNALKDALTKSTAPKTVLNQPTPRVQDLQPARTSVPTYQQPAAPPQPVRQQPRPAPQRSAPRPRSGLKSGDRNMLMLLAKGGILGFGLLLLIVIIIIVVALVFFAPDTASETTTLPTTAASEVVADLPTNVPTQPVIAVTSRAEATATLALRGPIITPVVNFVGMDAAQVRQITMLIPNSPAPVRDVAYSPAGGMVASAHGDGLVRLWRDVNSPPGELRGHSDVVSVIVFNADGSLLASAGRDMTIRLWDTRSGQTVSALSGHSGAVRDLAFSPDGQMLASAAEDGTVRLWAVASGQQLRSIAADPTRVLAVAFSPEGRTVASGGRNGLVRLWNAETGAEFSNLTGHSEEIRSVAFSPDGQFVASSSTDNSIIIWRRDNGQRVQTLVGQNNDVFVIAFNPDGTLLASGGRDNNIRLWDVVAGRELKTLTGHAGWVLGVAFAPDGASLISGSGDGSVRLWSDK